MLIEDPLDTFWRKRSRPDHILPLGRRSTSVLSLREVTMAEQFHFDPDTYLDMVRAEVPDYEQLQDTVAEAAGEVVAN